MPLQKKYSSLNNIKDYIRFFPKTLRIIAEKVLQNERISEEEGRYLLDTANVSQVGILANYIRFQKHGKKTFYNRNFHIEPTNVCVFDCKFCSYSRLYKNRQQGWELSIDDMLDIVKSYKGKPVTEVHIVGGVHPKLDLDFFCTLIQHIKTINPELHIKAFTAVELHYMFRKKKLSYKEGFKKLIEAGLDSIPGGGAEIFHPDIRKQICNDKLNAEQWLSIHKTCHQLGLHSNATILYGHIETSYHFIDHLQKLRKLQDETNGFKAIIPLKFRNQNNQMSHIPECGFIDDLKAFSASRIYLDNFPNIKAYWPMIGRSKAQLSQSFGVNDLDGTIDDSTKIYSMAGSEEQNPKMTSKEIQSLISSSSFIPVERKTNYQVVAVQKD